MSCIMNEYKLGTIAKYGLLEEDYKAKMLPKLDVEYSRLDGGNFIHVSFNNEIAQGLKLNQWIGSDYYEIVLASVSIPTSNRQHLNLKFALTHINEAQELHDLSIYGVATIAGRLTDLNIIKTAQQHFHSITADLAEAYRANRIPSGSSHDFKLAEVTQIRSYAPEDCRNPIW